MEVGRGAAAAGGVAAEEDSVGDTAVVVEAGVVLLPAAKVDSARRD